MTKGLVVDACHEFDQEHDAFECLRVSKWKRGNQIRYDFLEFSIF